MLHDVHFGRQTAEDGSSKVVATVACERRQCTVSVDVCSECERFARIEVHEAGYTMLCRSTDLDPALEGENAEGEFPALEGG